MDEDLNIAIFTTPEYEQFLNLMYIPTLPSDIKKVHLLRRDYQQKDSGLAGVTHASFYKKMMKDRWHLHYDCIVQNKGKNILFTDIDIVFLRRFKEDLLRRLEEHDMVFQPAQNPRHNSDGCTGFWAVKANDAIIEFMRDQYLPLIDEKPVEDYAAGYPQVEMQNLLLRPESSIIKFSLLPLSYGYDVDGSYLYHAMGIPQPGIKPKAQACWQVFLNRARKEELDLDAAKFPPVQQRILDFIV